MDEKTNKAIQSINDAIKMYVNKYNNKDKKYLDYLIIKGNIFLSAGETENAIKLYK